MRKTNFTVLALGLFSLFICWNAFAAETVGFNGGNEFVATELFGEIDVSCAADSYGSPTSASYSCEMEILDPGEYAYFVGPKGVDADKVVLKSVWENGDGREKSESYDSAKSISSDSFNLWISTLFQRPLLNYGKNTINYTLSKDGNSVNEGSFIANVKKATPRECSRRGYYYSPDPNDCKFPSGNLCGRYFHEMNYCQ